jgi:hypothetical protein
MANTMAWECWKRLPYLQMEIIPSSMSRKMNVCQKTLLSPILRCPLSCNMTCIQ